MSDLTWADLSVEDLDVPLLYAVLALRSEVFVVEQDCAYQDLDGADLAPGSRHLVGRLEGEPDGQPNGQPDGQPDGQPVAAYARLLAPDEQHDAPRIGRVVVAPGARGGQRGRALMVRALEACEEHWPGQAVELGGQAHLVGFYASLGFLAVGEGYVEDGIPHQWMRRAPHPASEGDRA